MGFDEDSIENRLRSMILDKTICGTLDHLTNSLTLLPENIENDSNAMSNIKALLQFFN